MEVLHNFRFGRALISRPISEFRYARANTEAGNFLCDDNLNVVALKSKQQMLKSAAMGPEALSQHGCMGGAVRHRIVNVTRRLANRRAVGYRPPNIHPLSISAGIGYGSWFMEF